MLNTGLVASMQTWIRCCPGFCKAHNIVVGLWGRKEEQIKQSMQYVLCHKRILSKHYGVRRKEPQPLLWALRRLQRQRGFTIENILMNE